MTVDRAEFTQLAFKIGVSAAIQPIEYAKILIQLGHEPVAPRPTYTIFGRPALALPNIFEYIGYVRRKRGFFGMYRGTTSRLCGNVASSYIFSRIIKVIPLGNEANNNGDEESESLPAANMSEEEKVILFFQKTSRDMLAQCAAVIVSHPFQVITVRTVAQFVGGEDSYNGLIASMWEIYKHDGIGGFFSGIIPRLIGELLAMWLSSCLTFVINTYLIKDKDLKSYTGASMSFIASTVTYPFILVSKVMAVNGSGLMAGTPPKTPVFSSWTDCWSYLKTQNQLKRGSSLLWRYYTGPYVLQDGKPRVVSSGNFRPPTTTKY